MIYQYLEYSRGIQCVSVFGSPPAFVQFHRWSRVLRVSQKRTVHHSGMQLQRVPLKLAPH